MTEDDINTYSFDPGAFQNDNNSNTLGVHNYASRAERTFQNYGGGGGSKNPYSRSLPCRLKNGIKYPKHLAPPHGLSYFPIGPRGCYHCGDDHNFCDCGRKGEDGALKNMCFNMHYHQPNMYNPNYNPGMGQGKQNNGSDRFSQSINYRNNTGNYNNEGGGKQARFRESGMQHQQGYGQDNRSTWLSRQDNNINHFRPSGNANADNDNYARQNSNGNNADARYNASNDEKNAGNNAYSGSNAGNNAGNFNANHNGNMYGGVGDG